jgi:hypothetical protein
MITVPDGRYKHFKGGVYEVLGTAIHTETSEICVCYRDEKSGSVYVRPAANFNDHIERDEYKGPRFTLITEPVAHRCKCGLWGCLKTKTKPECPSCKCAECLKED